MMEESNTGGWCAPSYAEVGWPQIEIELPVITINRDGGLMYPLPQLETGVYNQVKSWWHRDQYIVWARLYGEDEILRFGPYRSRTYAREVEQQFRSWYTRAYSVSIRTYKATERNKR